MRFKARAAIVFQFFTRCASSTMTSSGDQIEIRFEFLVVCDLAEIVRSVIFLALRPTAVEDTRRVFALSL